MQVEIIAGKAVGLFEPTVEWLAGTATTDKNGRFSINVEDAAYYKVGRFIKEGYFDNLGSHNKKGQNSSIDDNGIRENPTFYIDPAGTLHVVVENDPNVEGDCIFGSFPGVPGGINTCSNYASVSSIRAGRYEKYHYYIDGGLINKDSIFIIPFDTTFLNIIY